MDNELNLDNFKIEIKRKESQEKGILALVTLDYLGMRIKGFRVMCKTDSRTGEVFKWVAPPQYLNHARKKYSSLFYLEKEIWKELEGKILAQYYL